ncbi:7tm 6 domain containing protein [Asbolus verrucosus]|uniref:7tm 6 domain containing protein n=1 Tax=Asbolus verrucosus TaxID=1661398 RepID=A0A482VW55_ASBVE|nr:7tm 6 domain containing protein [Asbolus verrucosus]
MKRFDWKLTIKLNIFSLWMIGLWPKDNKYKFNFYTLYACFAISHFITSLGILATVNTFMVDSDFEDSEELTLYFIGEILTQIKVFMFIKNMRLLKQILKTLNDDLFQPKSLRQRQLIAPALNFWKMVYNAFTAAGAPVITLWVFRPLLNKSNEFQLPINVWYPFNTKTSPFYEIAFFHQIISVFYTVIFVYNADMLIAALMVYIGAQCDILSDDLSNLQEKSVISFNKQLANSIKHHKQILIFAENCNTFFNLILLGQFLASSIIISLILYRVALILRSAWTYLTVLRSINNLE